MKFYDFNPGTDYRAEDFVWYMGDLYQFRKDHAAGRWKVDEVQQVTRKQLINLLGQIGSNCEELQEQLEELEKTGAYKRYGVTGIELQASALTRIYDSIGMTAEVGTDDSTVIVNNDFDHAEPFIHRKCVGNWTLGEDGYPKFNVQAYLGDEDYAEDGTMGDYVAVELPLSYYCLDGNTLTISAHPYPGFRPFDIFCRDHDPNNVLEKVYVPAYALALDANNHAVCLPGLYNDQGNYSHCFENARKYNNSDVAAKGQLMPAALQFYYWALMTVEFAQQNLQSVMRGYADVRSSGNDLCKFLDETHVVAARYKTADHTTMENYNTAWQVAGDTIAIIATSISDIHNASYKATHKVLSVTRCDEEGTPDNTGSYQLLQLEDLGANYYDYDTTGATDYKIGGRPQPTGSCSNVVTPSGSPVSNSDGHHAMRYRYRENVYGNQIHTSVDLFDMRIDPEGNEQYELEWYYLPNPSLIETVKNPDAADLAAEPYEKLTMHTANANYVNGYIVSRQYDEKYPDIWAPLATVGGGDTKYYGDYAHLVSSAVVRSVRFGGSYSLGASDGPSYFNAFYAPSNGSANYGGDLCFPQ